MKGHQNSSMSNDSAEIEFSYTRTDGMIVTVVGKIRSISIEDYEVVSNDLEPLSKYSDNIEDSS
ncbi:MAG: hypothetical protein RTU92_12335 [Candidatus Thorarchaeota archaeon]